MNWIKQLFSRRRLYSDLSEEIREHLEEKIDELVAGGVSREEATMVARREFGNVTLLEERSREVWQWPSVESFLTDIRYGLRVLRKNPGFTFVAVLTLALGIGATTAIFGALNATLLRPFPFRDPGRLLMVWGTDPKAGGFILSSIPDYFDWRSQHSVFTDLAAYGEAEPADVMALNQHFRVRAVPASVNLLATLGVSPAGNAWLALEDSAGDRDAMISFHLWQDRLGGRSDIVGQEIKVNQQAYRVVAVLPADFPLPFAEQHDLVLPLASAGAAFTNRGVRQLHLVGRLRPGVTFRQAQVETARFGAELARAYPQFHHDEGARVGSLSESREHLRSPLWILFGAVVFLLLVACGNVASLLLARGLVRQKELAVRTALGASRQRIIRQLLAESLLLALFGGVAGFLLAAWGTRILAALGSVTVPQLADVRLDSHAAAFAALVTVSAALIFGLIPALEGSRLDVQHSLKEATASASMGSRQARLRSLLVAIQVALAVVVLCGAGLLLRSFYGLVLTNPGLRVENLVAADLSKSAGPSAQIAFYDELLSRVRAVPGVQYAAVTSSLPLGSEAVAPMPPITVPGSPVANPPDAMTRVVTSSYFVAMGIPMHEGRDFTPADSAAGERVAIVNEVVARHFFPGGHATGRELAILPADMNTAFPVRPGLVRIVGVIGDVMHWFTGGDPHLDYEVYLPYAQSPVGDMTLVVRSTAASPLLASSLETEIMKLDRGALIGSVTTMERELKDTVAPRRFYPALLSAFAFVALLLAAAGIYGVLAHLVRQRSHEIGIRLVLGARPAEVVRLVLLQGLQPAALGAAAGLVGAFGLTRFLESLLYGVRPTDPLTFAVVSLALVTTTLLASYIPARRATKVDPMATLRYE